jgi:hypothetical protein
MTAPTPKPAAKALAAPVAKATVAPPAWDAIDCQAQRLRDRRPLDDFADKVLTGALRTARDEGNPIRGNLFAAASRELTTHLLHDLAPEDQVRACAWFVQAKDTMTVTRAQRAAYITHGGMTPDYVEKTLGLHADDFVKPLTEAMDELNKRTHLKANTVLADDIAIRGLAADIFDSIEGLLDMAEECRSSVISELRGQIDQQIIDRMIGEVIGELDELSTHTQIEGHDTEEIEIAGIGPNQIRFGVSGTVYVTLQYGSGSDRRNGDGASMSDNYPFTATVITQAADPAKFEEIVDLEVDTSSFYE